jgi:hypothetical protein
VIAVVAFVLLVITTAGLPLAHWTQLPPYRPWRRR